MTGKKGFFANILNTHALPYLYPAMTKRILMRESTSNEFI